MLAVAYATSDAMPYSRLQAVAPMSAFAKTVGELGTYAAVTAWLQDFGAAGVAIGCPNSAGD